LGLTTGSANIVFAQSNAAEKERLEVLAKNATFAEARAESFRDAKPLLVFLTSEK